MSQLYPPSPDPSTYTSTGLSGSPGPSHPGTLGSSALALRASSPTPSETRLLSQRGLYGPLNWASVKAYLRLKNIPYILGGILILLVFILTISLNKKIAKALHPAGQTLRGLPGGWLIPVAVLVVVSFPPLLGHEIVAVFVGLIWGIGIGFGIVAFGTLLGELTNFYLFRYLFRKRAEGYERKNIKYGLLAHVVREGGFLMALMMRSSAIPSHFTTTVFSLTGMSSITFILAAIFSLPKQILGVAIGSMALTTNSSDDENSKIISGISIGGTAAVTLFAMWYTTRKIEAAKQEFVRLRRETRQASGSAEAGANLAESEQDFQPTVLREPIMAASVGLQASNTSYLSPSIPRVPHSYPPSP